MVAASRHGDGAAEIPQLKSVGSDVMREQLGEYETEITRDVLTLKDFVDDEVPFSEKEGFWEEWY